MESLSNIMDTYHELDNDTKEAIVHDFHHDISVPSEHDMNIMRKGRVSWSDSKRQSSDEILRQAANNIRSHGITFIGGSNSLARKMVIRDIMRLHNLDTHFATLCLGNEDIYSDVLGKYRCIEPKLGYDMQQYGDFIGTFLWACRVDTVVVDDDGLCRSMMFNMMETAPEEAHYIISLHTDFNDTMEEASNLFLEENTCNPAVRAYMDNLPYDTIHVDDDASTIHADVQHWMD